MTPAMVPALPTAGGLNIGALAGLFRHTTSSYKFVFFLALLEVLRREQFDAARPYAYRELVVEMLTLAWFAHTFFKLSFGAQDALAQKLDGLELTFAASANHFLRDRQGLRAALQQCDLKDTESLLNMVPYRLLRPFLEPHLTGVNTGSGPFERALPKIANTHFATARPLYRFNSDDYRLCSGIFVHPDWAAYLETHYSLIHGWAAWHWLQYMQRRNPATPAIANKLFPPAKRETLSAQTRFWRRILQEPDGAALCCLYSGEPLDPELFALDHYLPWSFVAHDQLWNLIPTPPSVNSAKSNQLPSTDYLSGLVALQHQGLVIAQRVLGPGAFMKATEDYVADLQVPAAALLDRAALARAYALNVTPLLTLAANQGFTPNWRYAP